MTTIGGEARLESLKDPAEALLRQVEQELRVEADREASRARFQSFVDLRDEAQFLGTLYTGMDLAANLQAARDSVRKALAVYGVLAGDDARPTFDAYLDDCAEGRGPGGLLPAPADPRRDRGPVLASQEPREKEQHLRRPWLTSSRPAAGRAPRAYHLRRARYLSLLGDAAEAASAEQAARSAPSSTSSITS